MTFEGQTKVLPIKGIERAGADNLCEDGAMNEVVGLEYRDKAFRPYKENSEIDRIPENTIRLLVHHTSTQDNLLAITSDYKLYWRIKNNSIRPYYYITQLDSDKIALLGNSICICDSTRYILWHGGTYVVNDMGELPHLSIRQNAYSKALCSGPYAYSTYGHTEAVNRAYQYAVRLCNNRGLITKSYMLCYAFKTIAGDYCYVSKPVMISHAFQYSNVNVFENGNTPSINTNRTIEGEISYNANSPFCYGRYDGVDGLGYCYMLFVIPNELKYKIESIPSRDDILSVDFFLTTGQDVYNIVKDGKRDLSASVVTDFVVNYNSSTKENALKSLKEDSLFYKVYSVKYANLVADHVWEKIDLQGKLTDGESTLTTQDSLDIIDMDEYKAEDVYVHNSRLYAMNSEHKKNKTYNIHDYFHQVGATGDVSMSTPLVYTTALQEQTIQSFVNTINGTPIATIMNNTGLYTNVTPVGSSSWSPQNVVIGLLGGDSINVYCIKQPTYYDVLNSLNIGYDAEWKIIVYYHDSITGEEAVTVKTGTYKTMIIPKLTALLSVNDQTATRLVVLVKYNGHYYGKDVQLDKSIMANVSTYNSASLLPIEYTSYNSFTEFDSIVNKEPIKKVQLRVTETSKPNSFELASYDFSNTRIIGLAYYSPTLDIDNYGKYPLTCFTEDGIYSLGIDATGDHAIGDISKISESICLNKNTICEINQGIIFSTEMGIKILTSSGFSDILVNFVGNVHNLPKSYINDNGNGMYIFNQIITNSKVCELDDVISKEHIMEILYDENTYIVHDKKSDKIVMFNAKSKRDTYLIDVANGLVTKLAMNIYLFDGDYNFYTYG